MQAIGEVLTASITELVAECWQERTDTGFAPDLPERPRFGSFLRVTSADNALNIFAVVCDVSTGAQDSTHKPTALKLTRDQLRLEQPHIFALLRTEIYATIIGYSNGDDYNTGLPPHPPEVHDFVYKATDSEIESITADLDFVRLITRVSRVPSDELVAATIREACTARGGDYAFLVSAGQSLAQAYRDDYERLSSVLRKIRPEHSA